MVPPRSHQLRCKPAALSINCNATRMSVLDTAGVLTFVDLTARGGAGEHREGERKVRVAAHYDCPTCHYLVLNGSKMGAPGAA